MSGRAAFPLLLGVDFSSAPTTKKPITVAIGRREGVQVTLQHLERLTSLDAFAALVRRPGPWLGGFDFPFGLPRAFADALMLGDDCASVSAAVHARCATRMDFRALIDAFGNTRPAGQRLLHRRCDTAFADALRSSSPLQTRYVPVGFMYYEGLSRLLAAGVDLPGLAPGDPERRALEAYPGALAHELIGRRSYKNGDDDERRDARAQMLAALRAGRTRLALRTTLPKRLAREMLDDASGDLIDALLALVQAAWAAGQPAYGLPADVDPVEGWIVSAG